MKNDILKMLKKIKDIIFLSMGCLFIFCAMIMLTEDIGATLAFSFIAIICLLISKDFIKEKFYKKTINEKEQQKIDQIDENKEIEETKKQYENEIKKEQLNLEYQRKMKQIEEERKKLTTVEPSEMEITLTINKIQELYKDNGFNVKVIDIIKKKYVTEYEVIFPKETNQYEILSISDKIIDNFDIDSVKIIGSSKKDNIV